MNNAINNTINSFWQDRLEGKVTKQGLALVTLTHNIIREYGTYEHNSYYVDVNAISLSDKKLVISHFESAEWYEWACEFPHRVEELFAEHKKYFQEIVDNECFAVYCEDREEEGCVMLRHPNNDECYFVGR